MIYLLTAVQLTPGGSSTLHIYTHTIHRTTQWNSILSTEAYETYNHIYSDTKWNQRNMKKYDKRNSQTSSKLHLIYVSSNNDRHPVIKTFNPLHYTCQHFIFSHLKLHPTTLHYTALHFSHLNFTQLHFTTFSFGLTPFKFPSAPFHLTSLYRVIEKDGRNLKPL